MNDCSPVQAVKLDENGLARLFGELEARIMEAAWALEEGTIHDVCRHLGANCNYKTIMTVTNRLVDKGVLQRRRCGRAFVYTPVATRDEFLESVSQQTVVALVNDFGAPAIAGVLAAVNRLAPEQIETLRREINQKTAYS